MRLIFLALILASCKGPDDPADQGDSDETTLGSTDSLLQFSGKVPSNILMISIDTFRADQLARYGGGERMPFLSQLADDGFAVDDMHACANWTFPTTACVLSGRTSLELAEQTQVLPQAGSRPVPMVPYPAGTGFLAEWMGDAGFYNILVTANNVFGPGHGTTAGYDEVEVRSAGEATRVFDAGLALLDDAQQGGQVERGWFLHMHLMDPHKPYDPPIDYLRELEALGPVPYDLSDSDDHNQALMDMDAGLLDAELEEKIKEHIRIRYKGEIQWLDDRLADVWDRFDDLGLLDDTLVVFWSDHGEQFFEHGLQSHGNLLHPEENDALLFFWAKGLERGQTDLPVAGSDLTPTLLHLYGIERPDVVTALPLHEIPTVRTRFAVVVGRAGPIQSAVRGDQKIHWAFADPEQTDEELAQQQAGIGFYDLTSDPDEQAPDVTTSSPEMLELWAEVRDQVERVEPHVQRIGFEVAWPADLP